MDQWGVNTGRLPRSSRTVGRVSPDEEAVDLDGDSFYSTYYTGIAYKDWLFDKDNRLIFHLSPERGGASVPEPGTLALFALGLAALGMIRRKRYQHI